SLLSVQGVARAQPGGRTKAAPMMPVSTSGVASRVSRSMVASIHRARSPPPCQPPPPLSPDQRRGRGGGGRGRGGRRRRGGARSGRATRSLIEYHDRRDGNSEVMKPQAALRAFLVARFAEGDPLKRFVRDQLDEDLVACVPWSGSLEAQADALVGAMVARGTI